MDMRTSTIFGLVLIAVGVAGLIVYLSIIDDVGRRRVKLDKAASIADDYLESLDNPDLAIHEVMEFENNFYVIFYEKSTGIGAFEMLIDKSTGRMFPEYGPNMMWNTKYGHGGMMGGFREPHPSDMPVNEEQALIHAQNFLDDYLPGSTTEEPDKFYGYYTIHILRNDEIYGMLSVNGYTSEVWYHNWHGKFIQMIEH